MTDFIVYLIWIVLLAISVLVPFVIGLIIWFFIKKNKTNRI